MLENCWTGDILERYEAEISGSGDHLMNRYPSHVLPLIEILIYRTQFSPDVRE